MKYENVVRDILSAVVFAFMLVLIPVVVSQQIRIINQERAIMQIGDVLLGHSESLDNNLELYELLAERTGWAGLGGVGN